MTLQFAGSVELRNVHYIYKTLLIMFIPDLFLNHRAFHVAGHLGGRIDLGRDVVRYIWIETRIDRQGASLSVREIRDVRSDSVGHYTSSCGGFLHLLGSEEISYRELVKVGWRHRRWARYCGTNMSSLVVRWSVRTICR